jgi:hypothetical protein
MNQSSFMHGWVALLESVATLALILTAIGLMLGVLKAAEVLKYIGSILAFVISLTILPGILLSAWTRMSLWQQIANMGIGIGILYRLVAREQTRKRR